MTMAQRGDTKVDDLLYRATVRNLRANIATAGFSIVREDLAVSRLLVRNLPRAMNSLVPKVPFVRDIFVTNMEYVLQKPRAAS